MQETYFCEPCGHVTETVFCSNCGKHYTDAVTIEIRDGDTRQQMTEAMDRFSELMDAVTRRPLTDREHKELLGIQVSLDILGARLERDHIDPNREAALDDARAERGE